jgi:glutamyl-tRNA synthetase
MSRLQILLFLLLLLVFFFKFIGRYLLTFLQDNTRWAAMVKETNKYPFLIRWYKFIESFPNVKPLMQTAKPAVNATESKTAASNANIASAGATGSIDIGIASDAKNICTRFPPEPSGYMHIGHAKAALLNDLIAKKFNGKCIVRFDDTNPSKEKDEYVQSIIEDIETLGIEYIKPITHTSDYFDLMLEYCTQMIKEGNAYVDDTDVETMRAERMACIESKNRNNDIAKNLSLWEEMKKGSEVGLKNSVRAKIDMSSRNGALRDPVIYRCNLLPHHRIG